MKEEDILNMEMLEEKLFYSDGRKSKTITRVPGGYLLTTQVINSRSEWNGKVISANRTETFIPLKS